VDAQEAYAEKRKFKRVRVCIGVVYRVNEPTSVRVVTKDSEIEARLLDLSEGGIALLTEYDLPVSTVIFITFTLFKIDTADIGFYGPMKITGEVRYNVSMEDKMRRLGISFIELEDDDRREIASFVKMIERIQRATKK
jgi:c-di-GMP-binding flagellar brake protein YcgR